MKTQHKQWALFSAAAALFASSVVLAGIADTKHNLSASGSGTYKATSETQLCVYCHAPHNTNPSAPLWNHALSVATYQPYASNTLAATGAGAPGQPTGSSKLCLTCHDGTVALGSVKNLPNQHFTSGTITGLTATLLGTAAEIGTDLRNDHPVSFAYDATLATNNPEIKSPATLTGKFRPESGELQCSNCHDAHSSANPKFMLTGYQDGSGFGSPLCLTCHQKLYWDTSPNAGHRDSNATWNGTGTNPWHIPGQNIANSATSTSKINGCESCHKPHGTTSNDHLLKYTPGTNQSTLCLVCHNGSVSSPEMAAQGVNIDAKLDLVSHHPAKEPAYAGKHSIRRQADGKVREDQANFNNVNRHAECSDCHNPHAAFPGRSPDTSLTTNLTNSFAPNTLKGVWGVEPHNYRTNGLATWTIADQYSGYTIIDDVQYTYQVCFKCHTSYAWGAFPADDPSGYVAGGFMSDIAKDFNPSNRSFHPAVGVSGKNDFIMVRGGVTYNYSRSLLIGGTAPAQTIQVSCLECHSNRDPIVGELGPKGVHGSPYKPLVWAPYTKNTGMTGTSTHICFRCHDYNVYMRGSDSSYTTYTGFSMSGKNLHRYHVNGEDVPCTGCHSAVPHGMYNKSLLIFGTGANKTPEPYNNHMRIGRRSNWGLNSSMSATLNSVASGNYSQSTCHNYSMGGAC